MKPKPLSHSLACLTGLLALAAICASAAAPPDTAPSPPEAKAEPGANRKIAGQLEVQSFPLAHWTASEAKGLLRVYLSDKGTIVADPRANQVVVTDYPENMRLVCTALSLNTQDDHLLLRATGPSPREEAALAGGILEEDLNLDLAAAVQSYQSLITQFDAQRPLAANAIFRLAECYRRSGRMDEARLQYARILREFSDQTVLARLCRKYADTAAAALLLPGAAATTAEAVLVPGLPAGAALLVPEAAANPGPHSADETATLEWQLAQARNELIKAKGGLSKAQAELEHAKVMAERGPNHQQFLNDVRQAQAGLDVTLQQQLLWSNEVARIEVRLKEQAEHQRRLEEVARLEYQAAEAKFNAVKQLFATKAVSQADYDEVKLALDKAAAMVARPVVAAEPSPSGRPETGTNSSPEALDPKVRALQQQRLAALREVSGKRLAALRQVADVISHKYQSGLATFDEVLAATREVLEAELDLCASDKERVSVLEKFVSNAKERESLATQKFKAGLSTQEEELKMTADRLRAEKLLEQARAKLAGPPK